MSLTMTYLQSFGLPWPNPAQQSAISQSIQASSTSKGLGDGRPRAQHIITPEDRDESDGEQSDSEQEVVSLLDNEEAQQFRDFDPEIKDPQKWQPPSAVVKYLGKHFNKTLTDAD